MAKMVDVINGNKSETVDIAIERIITKMEHLKDLWWDAEENKNQVALEEHNSLEQEIRVGMAEIGIDFDTVGAEYEDMINKLRAMIEA